MRYNGCKVEGTLATLSSGLESEWSEYETRTTKYPVGGGSFLGTASSRKAPLTRGPPPRGYFCVMGLIAQME